MWVLELLWKYVASRCNMFKSGSRTYHIASFFYRKYERQLAYEQCLWSAPAKAVDPVADKLALQTEHTLGRTIILCSLFSHADLLALLRSCTRHRTCSHPLARIP